MERNAVHQPAHTLEKRLRKDFGSCFLPPPCATGFWQANILVSFDTVNAISRAGMYTCSQTKVNTSNTCPCAPQ